LQAKSDPIKQRKLEFECFPKIFEDFSHSIMMAEKTACLAKSGDINYSHIAPEELKTVEDAVAIARSFLEEKRCLLAKASKTSDPPVTVSVLQAERKVTIQIILNYVFLNLKNISSALRYKSKCSEEAKTSASS
jgi:hypothetical protein